MEAKPSAECAKGGAGAYTDAIQRDPHQPGGLAGLDRGVVSASAFRTSYVPLSSQADFIKGLKVPLFPPQTMCFGSIVVTHNLLGTNVRLSPPPAAARQKIRSGRHAEIQKGANTEYLVAADSACTHVSRRRTTRHKRGHARNKCACPVL